MKNQREMILKHLEENGSITQLQAFSQYGIGRLAPRIFELKKQGHSIACRNKMVVNRYGKKSRVAEYYMVVENGES